MGVINPYYFKEMIYFYHGLVMPGDIGIIKINGHFDVKPMPIIVSKLPTIGEKILVAGYGRNENQEHPEHVKAAFMQVSEVSPQTFVMEYDSTNTNVCHGDSGGPAMGMTKYGFAIYGTTMGGKSYANCKEGDIAYFTNLSLKENIDFLKQYVSISTL